MKETTKRKIIKDFQDGLSTDVIIGNAKNRERALESSDILKVIHQHRWAQWRRTGMK